MFLLAASATATAYTGLGWPCSRLNWAWRNVWSTCSINSYVPTDALPSAVDFPPAHFRSAPLPTTGGAGEVLAPTNFLTANGVLSPDALDAGVAAEVPAMFCDALVNTGSGVHAVLRNRCRRAIDAYGGLVKTCRYPELNQEVVIAGPIAQSVLPDFQPQAGHAPHADNAALLAAHAQTCFESGTETKYRRSPQTVCPGLLGWFTVVWHACGFEAAMPRFTRTDAAMDAAYDALTAPEKHAMYRATVETIVPIGGELQPYVYHASGTAINPNGPSGTGDSTAPQFFFCVPSASHTRAPATWNNRGPAFRTSRCRKALDQFGRTAHRCGGTNSPADWAAIDAAAGAPIAGWQDPLRLLFTGVAAGGAGSNPNSLYSLAPLCNN